MKRQFLLILVALLPVLASAYDAEVDGIYYNISEDGASVTYRDWNYNSYSGQVYIAPAIDYDGETYPVTSIGSMAFYSCEELTYVHIPPSVKSIEDYAFNSCYNLSSITIPESVESIDGYVFYGCDQLTSISIPSSVTSIGECAFSWCPYLADIYCFAEDIPTTGRFTFDHTNISAATLHVPAASLEQYQTTEPWSGFGTIVGLTQDDIDAIEEVKASETTAEIARYDIHGRQISTPQRGINLIRYSDGTSKKVLVK